LGRAHPLLHLGEALLWPGDGELAARSLPPDGLRSPALLGPERGVANR